MFNTKFDEELEKIYMEDESMNDFEEKEVNTTFQFSSSQLKGLIQSVAAGISENKNKSEYSKKNKSNKTTKTTKSKKGTKDKFSAETPSFLLKFTEANEAKIVNNFKTQAVAKNQNPNKLMKYLILNTLKAENTLKYYSALKNDIYYSLRKAVYTSLSPFYLRLEENNIGLEHKYEMLNAKLNLVINLLLEKLEKTQFDKDINEKIDDLFIFNDLKRRQEQEYQLLKKKNQARKKEIYESFKNFLQAEQVDQIINDEDQLIARPTSLRTIKKILEDSYESSFEDSKQEKEDQTDKINSEQAQKDSIILDKQEEINEEKKE